MAVRPEVQELGHFAPLPDESGCSEASLKQIEEAVNRISAPLSAEEAKSLLGLFDRESRDTLYGLLWSIVPLLESAPGWPLAELGSLARAERPWFSILLGRCQLDMLESRALEAPGGNVIREAAAVTSQAAVGVPVDAGDSPVESLGQAIPHSEGLTEMGEYYALRWRL